MGELTSSVDMRSLLPPVRDQGKRGTCLAFAVTSGHESVRAPGLLVSKSLCEEVLYWAAKQLCMHSGSGITFSTAASALLQTGQPEVHFWPYDDQRDENDAMYCPPAKAVELNNCYRGEIKFLPLALQAEHFKERLRSGCPVVVTVKMSDPFYLAPNGHVPMPNATQITNDAHALLIVGFMDEGTLAQHFIFRNSWGSDWGDVGYGYLPYAYIEQWGIRAGIIEKI